MEQQTIRRPTGWQDAETARLFTAVKAASDEGRPLRSVFDELAGDLGRKPNSIRNYYYACLRSREDAPSVRAAPVRSFTAEETHELLRRVLIARGEGKSVRSCVLDMAGGDRSRMLRYQNKYRTLLRQRPDLIASVTDELRGEGLPCPGVAEAAAPAPASETPAAARLMAEPCIADMLAGIRELMRRASQAEAADERLRTIDRMRVEHDLQRMAWEKDFDEALDLLDGTLSLLREFAALTPEEQAANLGMLLDRAVPLLGRAEAFMTRVKA